MQKAILEKRTNIGDYATIDPSTDDDMLVDLWFATSNSENTKKQYNKAWLHISDAFGNMPIQAWNLNHLQQWSEFANNDYSDSTKRVRINAIKSLLTFAQKTGYIRVNPGVLIKPPKANKNVKAKVVKRDGINELIFAAKGNVRNTAIITTLYYTGCRVSELVNIKWSDVEYTTKGAFLYIDGKGDRERTVPLSGKVIEAFKALNDSPIRESVYVFPSPYKSKDGSDSHMSTRYINDIIEKLCKGVDLRDEHGNKIKMSAHWFRHTNATHQLEKGAPVHTVQNRLGHASLQTTSIYAHDGDNKDYLDD